MKLCHGLVLICLTPAILGCEQLGIEDPAVEKAREEAEGKAVGSGCRQTGRALEDCYQMNRRAPKAAIFAGWREMDAYMRENKISEIKPAESPENPLLEKDGTPKPAQEAAAATTQKSEGTEAKPAEAAPPNPNTPKTSSAGPRRAN